MEWNKQNNLDSNKKEQNALGQAVKMINSEQKPVKTATSTQESIIESWIKYIDKYKLAISKNGNKYLRVEAWNWLFSAKKLNVIIEEVRSLSGSEINEDGDPEESTIFVAKALLVNEEGDLVSSAYGACRLGESDYSKDFYSAMSMAQTRAVGKLGRTQFGHLAIMGGYQATPLEEVQ